MTKIEWTDEVWNPTTGCDRISPGCDNCYALGMAKRLKAMGQTKYQTDGDPRTSGPGFGITTHIKALSEPLRWKKPRKVFVNSMSDLFHARVPREFLAQVFAVMAATPQHTYQILTKRPDRAARILGDLCTCGNGCAPGTHFRSAMEWSATSHSPTYVPGLESGIYHRAGWPLPNVWIGTSVENQKYADLRIPALLDTPAAVRFLSCEPLLGPVDLSAWLTPVSPLPVREAPLTWSEWTWPDWVPAEVRDAIEGFWGPKCGRTPRDWMRDMHQQGAPAFGAAVTLGDGFGPNPPKVTGRFVHAWNNIGRLVREDGSFAYTSFHHALERRRQQPINWVIVGGESGHRARAVHPDWVRSLRDQSVAADVPFFMKQWGEWGPAPFIVRVCDPDVGWKGTDEELAAAKANSEARGATHVHTGNWHEEDGERQYWLHEIGHKPWSLERVALPTGTAAIRRWGKGRAGRELDGHTWDEFPKAATS
ncbi:phage Gp37/Gp68 family protein [Streptomyces sp. NPDC047990]|uniref:phage Gp37/Gp68 family protein n=1 Tax=Streptomyces sp. NPDC047990 TaxID=3365496 RepID=UPI00371B6C9D